MKIFIVFFLTFISSVIMLDANDINLKRFARVDDFLYRGAQPSYDDLVRLKEMGIKRIINFRAEKKLIEKERKEVEKLGLEYVSIPWVIYGKYREDVFDKFFASITDREKTFFHCKRGAERTGVMAGAYKIKYQNYDFKKALAYIKQFDLKYIWYLSVRQKLKEFYKRYKSNE